MTKTAYGTVSTKKSPKASLAVAGVLFALAGAAYFHLAGQAGQATAQQTTKSGDDLQAVTMIFGTRDHVRTVWDGSVSTSKGTIEKIVGYHFTEDSEILGNDSWKCSTHPWPAVNFELSVGSRTVPFPYLVQPIGVTIHYRAPADSKFTVRTAQGEASFAPSDIVEPEGIVLIGNRVEVHRTPVVTTVSDSEHEDDYPSLATDGDAIWLAWQAFRDGSEVVFLRRWDSGQWGQRMTVSQKPGDVFRTAVAAEKGKVFVVWSERDDRDWLVKSRFFDGSAFSDIETITPKDARSIFHAVASGPNGAFHVVYQSWRGGRSDIYLRSRTEGEWGPEINLSNPQRGARENDWRPAVAVDRAGTVWVAWDSYANGSYNIMLRPVRDGRPGTLIPVTDSNRFHANATIAIDSQDRVWLAWDEGGENWGKDYGFQVDEGTPLYESRTVKVAVYAKGQWMTTLKQPGELPIHSSYHHLREFLHTPRLIADSAGRMWMFVRPRTSANFVRTLSAGGGKWEVFAAYYTGKRWSELFLVPNSVGRNGGEMQVAADSKENVLVALVTDRRPWGGAWTGRPPVHNDILFARVGVQEPVSIELVERPPEPPTVPPSEPREREQLARLRDYVIEAGGKSYRIYRGDLHRHTEISSDGGADGTLVDAYRYAMDAADLDFLAVTDHQSGGQRYTWSRIEKSADLFDVPGFFTAIYGTERSMPYPNGHRNLFFPKRGVWILPVSPEERAGEEDTGPLLYPYLRENGGLASSHTSNSDMGTDWRDNDHDLEPLVEIYQGIRTNTEHERAPLSMTADRPDMWVGGYRPLGFVWNAWAKGYKLGVQSSSDHLSTHRSYACFIAENSTREGLLEAMSKRHSYAATSNILLDYRMKVDGGTHIQGDILDARSLPVLWVNVIGTAPLSKIHVIRDNEYIFSRDLEGETLQIEYAETSLTPGEHYYYVRVEQEDKNLAWSSPIWVTYQPERTSARR